MLADRYEGKRLNSPNDLVYRSDGTLYFTDPPFGLPKFFDDPRKELPFSGVYRCAERQAAAARPTSSPGPNGIAFSPDEKYLYVGNWDEKKKVVMRYPVRADGTLGKGEVFFDMTSAPGEDAIDGIKVDQQGQPLRLRARAASGSSRRRASTSARSSAPKHPHNFAWGDEDGRTLYLCAQRGSTGCASGFPGAGRRP